VKVAIRADQPGDAPAVREINEQAFGGPQEARIVDALRGAIGAISLVAESGDRLVGHILFTPIAVEPPVSGRRFAGLGPMAVRPDHQRRGIGGQLVRAGLDECRRLGYAAVVVIGHPEYYPRFGFVPGDTRGLQYEHPVPREAFMVLELETGALAGCAGVVRYPPQFDVA
jgi:putative acetyltransferase